MYFARRLRKRRITILSLSEKVNHIGPSAFSVLTVPGYLDALERRGTPDCVVNSIQYSDEQPDFNPPPDEHHGYSPVCPTVNREKITWLRSGI